MRRPAPHIQAAPALRPPRALATASAVIAGLAAGMLPIRFLGDFHLDCRKPFKPGTQVIREHKCAATAFDGAQCASTNRLVKGRPTGTRGGARFSDAVGEG